VRRGQVAPGVRPADVPLAGRRPDPLTH
jgi:hypothetical protein